jgi:hypothetical protein
VARASASHDINSKKDVDDRYKPPSRNCKRYRFDLRPDLFLLLRLLLELFFEPFFGGTFFPSRRASERPIAIACLRLLTFLPDRPLFKVPDLRFFIARPTFADAFFEYFRATILLPVETKLIFTVRESSIARHAHQSATLKR